MPSHRVLLIEDNDVDAAVFTRCVEAMDGWTVSRVRSLEEAEEQVETLGTSFWDLVAVDLTLPDAMDLEAVHFARTQVPQAACVAVTARDPREVDERALRAGAADLLVKGQMNARGVQRAVSHAVERNELVRRQLESERNLRSVLAAWNDALFVVGKTRRVMFRNQAATAFSAGLTEPQGADEVFTLDISPGDVLQTDVLREDGNTRPVEIRAWRITWADGPGTVVAIRDRSAERAADRARQLVALGRDALQGVHDIGNRLSALRGLLHEARDSLDGLTGDDALWKLTDALDRIDDTCDQIAHVVRTSRKEASKVRRRRIPVDLSALVQSCIQGMRTRLQSVATLRLQLEQDAVVLGEPADLTRVVDNLLANAVEAMAETTRDAHELRLQVRHDGDEVTLEVEDTAAGIPDDRLDAIFEEGVTFKPQGTGLGLPSVRRIVREHEGDVDVTSSLGTGTVFRVVLPALRRRAGEVRLLLIEDQPDVARANRRLLGDRYRVEVATDGVEAMERLADDQDFHVILCDLDMPRMDGRDFFTRLTEDHPTLVRRVVFCSGGATSPDTEAFLANAARPTLTKPFDLGEALPTIEKVADDVGAST